MTVELSLENIAEASQFIDPLFLRSPQFVTGVAHLQGDMQDRGRS
jgi:hypothetical protein